MADLDALPDTTELSPCCLKQLQGIILMLDAADRVPGWKGANGRHRCSCGRSYVIQQVDGVWCYAEDAH